MSVTPRLPGMPEPDEAEGGATVVRIEETGNGAKVTFSDGRDILVKPGDDWHISPITRDTQVVTQGNPEPRNFRDLHNAGQLPDILQMMLGPSSQVLPPAPAPTPAQGLPPPPPPGPPPGMGMPPGMGPGGPPMGGPVPMLPDMMGAVPGGPPPPGGATPHGGMTPAPGTPPPSDANGPIGMPPGSPHSPLGPPNRLQMPQMPADMQLLLAQQQRR